MGDTLYDKIFAAHAVKEIGEDTLLYIDRHIIHEVTSPVAFESMRDAGRKPWYPAAQIAVADHNIPTKTRGIENITDPHSLRQVETLFQNVEEYDIPHFPMNDSRSGIVHIMAPEQGFVIPGTIVVCGDSHTATHGAFGSIAMGIGTSEVAHVLQTRTLVQKKLKNMNIQINGSLQPGVTAKDIILYVIGKIGTDGGTGYAIEFSGDVFSRMSMEERMTVSNMAIEAGAKVGIFGVDNTTIDYVKKTPFFLEQDEETQENMLNHFRACVSDSDASFDTVHTFEASKITTSQVSWGTSPEEVIPIDGTIPLVSSFEISKQEAIRESLEYMGLQEGQSLEELSVDGVFIGSCTNGRLSDLKAVAEVIQDHGGKIAENIEFAWIVPGSGEVKEAAENLGLDKIFIEAGFEWRYAGCSACLAMNEDKVGAGKRCASTSNRNFKGRQGRDSRTHLCSPKMAALAALHGHFVNPLKKGA